MKTPVAATAGILLAWAAAAGLASRLPSPAGTLTGEDGEAASAVSRLFGSGREVISRQLYLEADRYFHRGAAHVHRRAFADHPYLRWAEVIAPSAHAHLSVEGGEIEEIMPWLQLATRADPRNIDAYASAAYWLNRAGRVDAARAVLDEARVRNPGDYRIPLALGQLLYHDRLLDEALAALDQARAEWPSGQAIADRQTQLDRAAILSLGAGIHEILGHRDEAILAFRDLLRVIPDRAGVRERLRRLEDGEAIGDAAAFLDHQLAEISSAAGGPHVAGGGHAHDDAGEHDHPEDGEHPSPPDMSGQTPPGA